MEFYAYMLLRLSFKSTFKFQKPRTRRKYRVPALQIIRFSRVSPVLLFLPAVSQADGELMTECWAHNPASRLTALQVRKPLPKCQVPGH